MSLTADALLLPLTVLIPLVGAILIPIHTHKSHWREKASFGTALVLFIVVLQLLDVYFAGGRPTALLWEIVPDLSISLALHPVGLIFALVASTLWLVTTLYSVGYLRGNREENQTRYYMCFAIALAATMMIAGAGNLLTLFIGYELLTLSTYPLVVHSGTQAAMQGGRTYLGVLMGASLAFLLPAILIVWNIAGTLDFTRGGILTGIPLTPWQTGGLLALFAFGTAKAALMPLHRWLPAAMVAPTPVSALLHAVAVVKAGVYSLIVVIIYIFGTGPLASAAQNNWLAGSWLVYVSGLTILLASIVALRQDNLKKRLAYSTVSQLSYVVMAAALLSPLAMAGAVLHLVAHAFGKITLFFVAGSIYTVSKKTKVSELNGIGRAMPWTMGAFTIGVLSLIGLPPTIGFVSKWYILMGAMEQAHYFALFVLIASTLLNAAYLLPIVYAAFFRKPTAAITHGEAPKEMRWAVMISSAFCVILFFNSGWLLDIVREALPLREALHLP